MTDRPFETEAPCRCGYSEMELERVELTSQLTGITYDCIRCSTCKDIFQSFSLASCDECGSMTDGTHQGWCSNSDMDWPPFDTTESEPA